MAEKKENTKLLAQNKKARHEYFILETIEAGIELAGTEVKSARQGKVNLVDSYASVKDGEVFVKQNIAPILELEKNIFAKMTEQEGDIFLELNKKYLHYFKQNLKDIGEFL